MNQTTPVKTGGARLGLVVGGILVVAVVAAAIVQSVRPVQELDPTTAEGVVQTFLLAIDEERYDDAHAALSTEARFDCEPADLAVERETMSRVVVEDVNVFDDETIVVLNATVIEEDPFDPYRYETTLEFAVVNEGGAMRIDRLPYSYFCRSI